MATIKPSGILSGRQSLNRSNPHYPRLMAVTIAVILVTLALWQASATGSLMGIVSSTTLLVMGAAVWAYLLRRYNDWERAEALRAEKASAQDARACPR